MSAATILFRNAYVWLDANDLSGQVKTATLNYKSEMLDRTVMGDTTRNRRGGLFDWSVDLEFLQGVASSVDSILFSLVGSTSLIELRQDNSCSTAVNPRYFGVGVLQMHTPMTGPVGTLLPTKVTFNSAGALTRSVTAS